MSEEFENNNDDQELTGTLHSREDAVFIESKEEGKEGFYKQHFVVKTDHKFAQYIQFEMTGKPLKFLSELHNGAKVIIHYNLRGNIGNRTGRCFTYLRAFKIIRK